MADLRPRIVGITRIRNESEIILDTLRHAESLCDGIVVYDDCSTDGTADLVVRHAQKLLHLVRGKQWSTDRLGEETAHRRQALELASSLSPEWILCFDADERFDAGLREFLLAGAGGAMGVRVRFFDAYLSPACCTPYPPGGRLAELP